MSYKVDFKKFKKISSDAKTTVLQHPAGHKIMIAHGALDEKTRQELHQIPHFAEGGMSSADQSSDSTIPGININIGQPQNYTPDPNAVQAVSAPQVPQVDPNLQKFIDYHKSQGHGGIAGAPEDRGQMDLQKYNDLKGSDPEKLSNFDQIQLKRYESELNPPAPVPTVKKGPQVTASTTPAISPDLEQQAQGQVSDSGQIQAEKPDRFGLDAQAAGYQHGYDLQEKGMIQGAAAGAQLGRAEAKIYENQTKAINTLQDQHLKDEERIQGHIDDLQNEMKTKEVDPSRLWKNMDAPQKFKTTVGLILGGMSAGWSGGENQVMKWLNNNIERDIEAQKTDMNKQQNLISDNYKLLGNMRDAHTMTRVNLMDSFGSQLKEAMSKTQNPLLQGRLQEQLGVLERQKSVELQQMTMRRDMMREMSGSQQDGTDKMGNYINQLRFVDPKQSEELSKRYIPGIGLSTVEVPDATRQQLSARKDLDDKMTNLIKFTEQHSGSLDPATIAQGKAMAANVQDATRRANGLGVFREGEQGFISSIIASDPTQFFSKFRGEPRYKQFKKDNIDTLNSMKKAYGIHVSEGKTASQGWK